MVISYSKDSWWIQYIMLVVTSINVMDAFWRALAHSKVVFQFFFYFQCENIRTVVR